MHAATLAILLVSVSAAPVEHQDGYDSGYAVPESECSECGECGECGCGGGRGSGLGRRSSRDQSRRSGPMPQTCYAPRYGCYPGNNRHMHRYPAFHGTYYRRPYNYRNLFDYPWHAELHEPTSLFSHETPDEERYEDAEIGSDGGDAPPQPAVDAASVLRLKPTRQPANVRSASSASRSRRIPQENRWRASDVHRRHRPGSAG